MLQIRPSLLKVIELLLYYFTVFIVSRLEWVGLDGRNVWSKSLRYRSKNSDWKNENLFDKTNFLSFKKYNSSTILTIKINKTYSLPILIVSMIISHSHDRKNCRGVVNQILSQGKKTTADANEQNSKQAAETHIRFN